MVGIMQNIAAYGFLGMLVECFFTGAYSVAVHRNYRATSTTYLWMWPIYGVGGYILENIHNALSGWHGLVAGVVYMLVIYAIEFGSGLVLKKLVGRCPWDYGAGRWTPLGLINLRFMAFWYALGVFFHYSHHTIIKAVNAVSRL